MDLGTLSIIGIVALAALVVVYLKLRQRDLIGAFMDKRRASSRLVSRADYVEGAEKIPVSLSLGADTLYYENADLEASFELSRLDEIEYGEDLMTGVDVPHGYRILRLRSHGATFEFMLEKAEADKWAAALPARAMGGAPTAQAV